MRGIILSCLIFLLASFSMSQEFEERLSSIGKEELSLPSPSFEAENQYAEVENFFKYFDSAVNLEELSPESPAYTKSISRSASIYSINLDEIKNQYLKGPIFFKTSKGTTVYVSASKSSNCPDLSSKCADKEKFFMILTTSRGETFFIRAMSIVNLGFLMSGSKTVVIDGEKYTAKVYANASSPEKSKLEIKGPSGAVISSSLDKLGQAVAANAMQIKLSKTYKLAYGNEIVQTGGGNAKFTQNTLLLLIPYPVQDASSYFLIKTADIKPTGSIFPSMEPNYIFKKVGSTLEILKK